MLSGWIVGIGAFQLLEYVDVEAQLSRQLETGEFIHLRSHGVTQAGPGVQAKAVDEVRMTLSGTRLPEAHPVNRLGLA